jgi:o-succinylbenzoate synthase
MITRLRFALPKRDGLLLRYGLAEPYLWSEASPLPGFSSESLADILTAPLSSIPDSLPSLRFALDGLRFQQSGFPERFAEVPVNALIPSGDIPSMRAAADVAIAAGYRTLKIKIGRDIDAEIEFLSTLAALHPHLRVRLDANARFTLRQATELLPRLASVNPEYLEQPVASTDDLMALARLSPIPIAADESVRTPDDAKRLLQDGAVRVLILKPMMIGWWSDVIRIMESSYSKNVACVITTSLESGVGRRLTAMFASTYAPLIHAHGLATGFLYPTDLLRDDHLIRDGFYHPEPIGEIRTDLLSPV